MAEASPPPFAGLTVVDFTHVLAGPACAYFLGLLGADVIKVESVGKGDSTRHRGGTDKERSANAMSTAYLTQGGGKKSLALDLGTPEGLEIFHKLLASADVYVENHRPSTTAAIGIDEVSVRARHPHLIYCAMSGYGRGGTLSDVAAYDANIQAACGIMTMTGSPGDGPTRTGAPIVDYATGLAAAFAVSSALFQRTTTGTGTLIDVSMLETAYTLMSSTVADFLITGNVPEQRGNAANSRSPGAGSFPCKEGLISLAVNEEHQFASLAKVLGREEWLSDPKFKDRAGRTANEAELVDEISAILLTRTAKEWEPDMMAGGVPAARVRNLPESLDFASAHGRHYLHAYGHTGVTVPTLPFRIGDTKAHLPTQTPPRHGEQSRDVLIDLGYSEAEIEAFIGSGAIKQDGT